MSIHDKLQFDPNDASLTEKLLDDEKKEEGKKEEEKLQKRKERKETLRNKGCKGVDLD